MIKNNTGFEKMEDSFWEDINQAVAEDLTPTTFDEELMVPMESYHPTFANLSPILNPDLVEMQQTLLAVLSHHLNPMCRYMKALSQGEESTEIFEITEMMISALIPKLEEAQLKKHAEDLIFFRSLMFLILGESDQHAVDELKNVILKAFAHIQMTFQLNYRGYKKAIENIVEFYRAMKQTPSIRAEDIRKFFGIGIPSITWVRKTKSSELQSISGIDAQGIAEMKKLANLYYCLPSGAQSMRTNFGSQLFANKKPDTVPNTDDIDATIPDIYVDESTL